MLDSDFLLEKAVLTVFSRKIAAGARCLRRQWRATMNLVGVCCALCALCVLWCVVLTWFTVFERFAKTVPNLIKDLSCVVRVCEALRDHHYKNPAKYLQDVAAEHTVLECVGTSENAPHRSLVAVGARDEGKDACWPVYVSFQSTQKFRCIVRR